MTKRLDVIPNFIVASSPQGLRRLMRLNNLKLGGFVRYFDIQQDKSGKWYAWYHNDLKTEIQDLEKELAGGDE